MRIPLRWLIVLIPVVNAIADVTTNYVPTGWISPGELRVGILIAIICCVLLARLPRTPVTVVVLVFLAYLLALSLLSSNRGTSVVNYYSKVFVSTMMLPLGYRVVRSFDTLKTLHQAIIGACVIIVAQLMIAQVFRFGDSVYLEDSFYLGGGLVHIAHTLTIAILIYPLMLALANKGRTRLWVVLVLAVNALNVLLLMRRGAILALLVGVTVLLVRSSRKLTALKYASVLVTILIAAAPLYMPILAPRLEVRSFEQRPIESELRVWETQVVVQEFMTKPVRHVLLGTELFNSQEYFKQNYAMDRRLHVDFNILLHGAGAIGVALYALVYVAIIWEFRRYNRRLTEGRVFRDMRTVFWALLISSMVVGVSHSISIVGYRSLLFLYIGALLGVQAATLRQGADPRAIIGGFSDSRKGYIESSDSVYAGHDHK